MKVISNKDHKKQASSLVLDFGSDLINSKVDVLVSVQLELLLEHLLVPVYECPQLALLHARVEKLHDDLGSGEDLPFEGATVSGCHLLLEGYRLARMSLGSVAAN